MNRTQGADYWSGILIQIRNIQAWNQSDLAKELGVTKDTISRWENETKFPSLDNQQRIGELATSLNVASVYGINEVVMVSPFAMILTDKNDYILAASKVSGFEAGKTVIEQTPENERRNYEKFLEMVANTGFWDKAGVSLEYKFDIDGEQRKAVIQSVGSRGHIFALVQKL